MAYTKNIAVPIQVNAGGAKYYAKFTVTLNGTSITKVAVSGVYSDSAMNNAAGTVASFSGGSTTNGTGTWQKGDGSYGNPLYRFSVSSVKVESYILKITVSSTYQKQTSSSGTSSEYTNGTSQSLTANINHWSVTYEPGDGVDGSAYEQVKVESTTLTLRGATYTRDGYDQTGWTTSEGSTQTHALSASYTSNAALSLYPVFTPRTYSVTLNANGGTINSGNVKSYTYGTGAQLPASVTRNGFTFKGWYGNDDLSGDQVYQITASDIGDKAYWAKWDGTVYTVTLHTDGGELAFPLTGYKAGTATQLPTDVRKAGHTFKGWYTTSDLYGTPVTEISAYDIGDKEYWAKFSVNTYPVILQTNGGTINGDYITSYVYGNGAQLPTDVTRAGYAFGGWYATEDFSGERIEEISSTATGSVRLLAKWTPTYRVTFVDGDGLVIETQDVLSGEDATPPEPPARTGFSFAGWSGNYLSVTSDETVSATYEEIKFTVVFLDFDGTILKEQSVTYGSSATAPSVPDHDGYTFTGWSVPFTAVTGPLTVTAVYSGEANYRVRARRYQRLYKASRYTPAYAAAVEASRIAATICTVPWTEAVGVNESFLPAHSGTSDEDDDANVSARASFDAAIFCAEHRNGQHRAFAQATCYRFSLPSSARGKRLNTISLVASGDPYLRDGARISVLTNDTGVIPMDCATCRNGDYYVAGVCRRTVSADGSRWFGATQKLTLMPPEGIELGAFLYVFVMLEDYSYTRQEYLEGAACIQPDVYLGLDGTVAGWSTSEINYCYEDIGHAFNVTTGGTLPANSSSTDTGTWSITLQANGDALDRPAFSCVTAADRILGLRAVYAALYTQGLGAEISFDSDIGESRIGAGFSVRRTTANVGGTQVPAWNLTASALMVKTSLPATWKASTIVLDWSSWTGTATTGSKFNVWIRRGVFADAYTNDLTKPALWDSSSDSESGFELVGVIDATSTDKHAEFRLNTPLTGYVATFLFTAFVPLDDNSPTSGTWESAGAPVEFKVTESGDATGTDKTWIPDIILKG